MMSLMMMRLMMMGFMMMHFMMMRFMMMRFMMMGFIKLMRCLICLIPTFQPPLYLSCSLVHRQTGGSKSKTLDMSCKTLDMSMAISKRVWMRCACITLLIRKLPTHKVAAGKVAVWVDMTDRLLMDMTDRLLLDMTERLLMDMTDSLLSHMTDSLLSHMTDSLLNLLDITGSLLNLLVLSLPPTSLMHMLSLSRACR